jgi:hypothetical protein
MRAPGSAPLSSEVAAVLILHLEKRLLFSLLGAPENRFSGKVVFMVDAETGPRRPCGKPRDCSGTWSP